MNDQKRRNRADGDGVNSAVLPDLSTTPTELARESLAAAMDRVSPTASEALSRDHKWPHSFARHLTELDMASAEHPETCAPAAEAGLAMAHGLNSTLPAVRWGASSLKSIEIRGHGERVEELRLPYEGRQVAGQELLDLVGQWVDEGLCVSDVLPAIQAVQEHPEWLKLQGHTVAVLGATAKIGPAAPLLRWGARVLAVDLPGEGRRAAIAGLAKDTNGTAILPAGLGNAPGIDLFSGVDLLISWLHSFEGPLTIFNALRAAEGRNFRLALAADRIVAEMLRDRADVSLGYLPTPADSYLVSSLDQATSRAAYATSSGPLVRATRSVSRGIALQPNYPYLSMTPVVDAHMPQHSWDFTMAKRVERWRAASASSRGVVVSNNVAPATVSRQLNSRAITRFLAARVAMTGVTPFPVNTTQVLMAALLVHDLQVAARPLTPLELEYHEAVHGGMWTAPYKPSSVVGLAIKGRKAAERLGMHLDSE